MEVKCIGCGTVIPPSTNKCPACTAPAELSRPKTQPMSVVSAPPQSVVPSNDVHHYHHRADPDKPILTEKTAKKWKKQQLIGIGMICLSVPGCIASGFDAAPGETPSRYFFFSMLMAGMGFIFYMTARARAWWHHG